MSGFFVPRNGNFVVKYGKTVISSSRAQEKDKIDSCGYARGLARVREAA
jgi:hypothetical protein